MTDPKDKALEAAVSAVAIPLAATAALLIAEGIKMGEEELADLLRKTCEESAQAAYQAFLSPLPSDYYKDQIAELRLRAMGTDDSRSKEFSIFAEAADAIEALEAGKQEADKNAKAAFERAELNYKRAEAAEAERDQLQERVTNLEGALENAIVHIASGRLTSMGGLENTFCPQISVANLNGWRATLEQVK